MELLQHRHISRHIYYGLSVLAFFVLILVGSRAYANTSPFGDFYDKRGNKIGSDGKNDGKKFLVTKRSDTRTIRKITRLGGTIQEKNVRSSVVLPSDAALRESLAVLNRTEEIGGLKEQSSIVMKDDSVIRGMVGERARIENNLQIAECILPALPEGKTRADVETTIHPHPTTVTYESGGLYPHSATTPSTVDRGTFAYFTTNIIVGPVDQITFVGGHRIFGAPKIANRRMGIAVYYHNGNKPSVIMTKRVAEKILNLDGKLN